MTGRTGGGGGAARDLAGFGRRRIDVDPADLVDDSARCVELARTGKVRAVDGALVDVPARSLCVHGDTPGAVGIARQVRAALLAAGIAVRPFTVPG